MTDRGILSGQKASNLKKKRGEGRSTGLKKKKKVKAKKPRKKKKRRPRRNLKTPLGL